MKLTVNFYNGDGDKQIATGEAEPECGEDFCEVRGDYLHCYDCDCAFWIIYNDEARFPELKQTCIDNETWEPKS